EDSDISNLKYDPEDMDSRDNIFHAVEILYNKVDMIPELVEVDFSGFRIAAHHACHYCKVHNQDTIGNARDPMVLETLARACGVETVDWYDHKTNTCGNGFRHRYMNKELSFRVTAEKLMSLKENDVDILLHMCPNCQLQFDRSQKIIGESLGMEFNIICLNISQFLALALGADPYKVVGIQTHTADVEPILDRIKLMNHV
ncbi:MAG: heterodisulfide reductase-related iron-sulfur binding cluster, partial [Methanobacterium sp.]